MWITCSKAHVKRPPDRDYRRDGHSHLRKKSWPVMGSQACREDRPVGTFYRSYCPILPKGACPDVDSTPSGSLAQVFLHLLRESTAPIHQRSWSWSWSGEGTLLVLPVWPIGTRPSPLQFLAGLRSSVSKLDGGAASGDEGPAFVLRHRTSNPAERTTNGVPTDPMSPRQDAEDTPTSGCSTNHLSATECPHVLNGVPSRPMRETQVPSRPMRETQVPSRPMRETQVPSRPMRVTQVPSRPMGETSSVSRDLLITSV
ncbi:hypothetical protein NHX12_020764 [Muraenolepis orangiensis]|uniref:Uncharacterized protein n=1 Tax=Muraenolepis orangiensis TaxID=630683 RepID=A0A9Q0IVG5_9TELE|nr:hypothetical protein NHX12_020764 [Muraenolepis orangiensis]